VRRSNCGLRGRNVDVSAGIVVLGARESRSRQEHRDASEKIKPFFRFAREDLEDQLLLAHAWRRNVQFLGDLGQIVMFFSSARQANAHLIVSFNACSFNVLSSEASVN